MISSILANSTFFLEVSKIAPHSVCLLPERNVHPFEFF